MQITCKELNFIYNEKTEFSRQALKDVSLTILEGDFFGIIGQTGSGKSTFIQHLNGLIPVQKGSLKVGEFDLSNGKKTDKKLLKELRKKVGMVFQYPEYQLFAETCYEDVAFGYRNFINGSKEDELSAVKSAIESVGLDFEQVKNKSPFDLSGGQKRRIAIAGVIVTKPEVLILDEPVAGLDPLGKKELMKLLHSLHETVCKTIIIVSHDMDEVCENCNKIAVFRHGSCVLTETPEILFSKRDMLNELRLDVPITAKIVDELKKRGVDIDTNYKMQDFIDKITNKYKE
ncbi:MAG: energy-coupling factor transporter ATPase [Clostridia bacterium]|nr:energy-coupling factor transporter ATPase [Clostridia bacterium]